MMDRCWEELRYAGRAITDFPGDRSAIVNAVASYFEVPSSPEAEAVRVFLDGLGAALEGKESLALDDDDPPEAAATTKQFLPDRILEMQRRGIDPKDIEQILQREGVSQAAIMTAVFGLAISGKLRPTNAAAEIVVQDAAEAVHKLFAPDHPPEVA